MATKQDQQRSERVTVNELAQAISAAMPRLDASGQQIAIVTYRLLAEGEPVSPAAIARSTKIPVARVEEALASWPGVYRDMEGRVAGFWGLAIAGLEPEYRLQIEGKTSFAWCALDTLFIPGLLGKTVGITASCPVTDETVSLVVDGHEVRDLKPAGAVMSVVIPDGPFGYDVIESFCHRVFFFASREAGAEWAAKHPGTTLLPVEEAFALGQAGMKLVYGDLLGSEGVRV